MKRKLIRAAAIIMMIVTLAVSCVSCSSGQTLMKLGREKISINLYELYLSRQKGTLCTTYYYGSKAKFDDFWDTTISTDGTTYNDYWTSYIYDCVKVYLAALYLFDEEYKLTLPQSYIDQVDEKMNDLLIGDGNGSKSELNSILSRYGVNYNMLRESYIIQAKVDYLQTYLYGSNLSKVSDELKEQYYRENYVRFKQVFFANYYYVYETDENGDTIYFDDNDHPVYDSSTGIRKFDENGKALTDENGNIVYYNEDGSVAYDTKKGKPAYTFDDDGNYKTAKYSKEELEELATSAEDIAEFTTKGDFDTFEDYIKQYSDDTDGQTLYEDGYYFSIGAQYSYQYIVDIISELCRMEVGEIRVVESDFGYHVIMKYELDEGAYEDKDKDVWFEGESSSFTSDVMQWLFNEKCKAYIDDITVSDKLIGTVDMKSVSPNYYY